MSPFTRASLTDFDDDRPQRKTERGGYVVTTGGVCLDGEEKGQIDRSKVVLDGGRDRAAGKTCVGRHGFPGISQNARIRNVPRVHMGNVGVVLTAVFLFKIRQPCRFRRKPATYSDLIAATLPI